LLKKMIKVVVALALLVGAAGECPNACSGHGTCSLHDQCTCCRDYTGSDCSERICPFGNSHVDSPNGDLDGSTGTLSGPTDTVIKGSNMFPYGATEQFPDTDEEEGHFYMECSNKGLCDRSSGTCECFPGYEGSACQRASCPNDCSGHGTCETIKELAEDKEDGDLDAGAYGERGYAQYTAGMGDLSAIGSLKYELWDKTLTMGCKCDPGFTGPDCSLKLCRYGVDPLFIPSSHRYSAAAGVGNQGDVRGLTDPWDLKDDDELSDSAPMYEKSFVEIVTFTNMYDGFDVGQEPQKMSGSFDLVIYDVYGEKFTLDKLKYSHFDEMSASYGYPQNHAYSSWNTLSKNHTTCEEIMAYFPNDKIKDTTLGTWQNQMKHKGGLISTAFVSGSTKPFCSVTKPRGQNVTMEFLETAAHADMGYRETQHTETTTTPTNCGALDATDGITSTTATTIKLDAGCSTGNEDVGNGDLIKVNSEYMIITDISSVPDVTVIRGVRDSTAATHAAGDAIALVTANQKLTETFGIRYNFDYNRGNPGYHKDLYIENLIPAPGLNIPVRGFYGTIKQGMVAEIRGDDANDRRAKTYDVTLPGYVMAAAEDGNTILFSEDLSSYLAGTDEKNLGGRIPDHKTSHIYMLGYYYEIKSTRRVIVDIDAAIPKYSDYMLGERDIQTNSTVSTFATLATLQTPDAQVTTFANVLGATPDDEDRGRAGCKEADEPNLLRDAYAADCGNTGQALFALGATDGFNHGGNTRAARSAGVAYENGGGGGTNAQFSATSMGTGALDANALDSNLEPHTVEEIALEAANDNIAGAARGDFMQVTGTTEIMYVVAVEDATPPTKVTVARGVSNTGPGASASYTDHTSGGAANLLKIVNDHGDAGVATGATSVSNYKNTVSFMHSTEGLDRIFCEGGYVTKIVDGKYVCSTSSVTDVPGDVRITVKAKLSQPYQYVSECSNRGSCDREAGICRCYTGYTHDNCDTQTPVC
jgi:hypothetical protein